MNSDDLPPLLDCPFCGGVADYKAAALAIPGDVLPITPWVQCLTCGARTESAPSGPEGTWKSRFDEGVAIVSTKWNARSTGGDK